MGIDGLLTLFGLARRPFLHSTALVVSLGCYVYALPASDERAKEIMDKIELLLPGIGALVCYLRYFYTLPDLPKDGFRVPTRFKVCFALETLIETLLVLHMGYVAVSGGHTRFFYQWLFKFPTMLVLRMSDLQFIGYCSVLEDYEEFESKRLESKSGYWKQMRAEPMKKRPGNLGLSELEHFGRRQKARNLLAWEVADAITQKLGLQLAASVVSHGCILVVNLYWIYLTIWSPTSYIAMMCAPPQLIHLICLFQVPAANKVSALGFFSLSRSTAVSMVGAILTFLILLVQSLSRLAIHVDS